MNRIAWHGWKLQTPDNWNPVKVDGEHSSGLLLLADMHQPRLGLKWAPRPRGKKLDLPAWIARMMRNEVGQLAAAEARPLDLGESWGASLLYEDPEPPGRDVWIGYSAVSKRAIQLACHVRGRRRMLRERVLPTLADQPADGQRDWSIFELNCRVPAEFRLLTHRLDAGDLSLTFTSPKDSRRWVMVRQVAVARLALSRMPMERWLAVQQRTARKRYRIVGKAHEIELTAADRPLIGLAGESRRRRRFFWMLRLSPRRLTYALLDEKRDRLVMVESSDESLANETAATVGNG